MKRFILVLFPVILVGCAQSSGVLKMGPDTYTVSVHAAPARGGQLAAKKLSIEEANSYCTQLGKEIVITNTSLSSSSHLPGGTSDITFKCLDKGDRELVRPSYRSAPDVVIENR